MNEHDGFEHMAKLLAATGRYRILRKLESRTRIDEPDGSPTRLGIFLDLETTGLDDAKDEIIEFGMVPFNYTLDGRIFDILEPFSKLREPSFPIPEAITALTGIDNAAVAGLTVAAEEVEAFVAPASLVIAHNASFDRLFAERFCGVFADKPWACSMKEIPWAKEGFEGTKLSYLAAGHGFFYDGHRAIHDCAAGVEILARRLRTSDRTALAALLESARQSYWRIWAENSPFELKNHLKGRGYRWNDGTNGNPKAWYIDVPADTKESELSYLRKDIYQRDVDLLSRELTAYERYSSRC
jgi:DNA polymerase-3 subunit epsilon